MTQIWGHRGASAYAPENTLEAFKLAFEQGADGIELDVQLTKDGELVVIHDWEIDRVSDGTGFVQEMTLSELRQYSFHQAIDGYRSCRIPTLSEVLQLVEAQKKQVNIELKCRRSSWRELADATYHLVQQMGMKEQVIYSSFFHDSLRWLRKKDPQCQLGALYEKAFPGIGLYINALGVNAVHPPRTISGNRDQIKRFQQQGLAVHVWTVDDEAQMRVLAAAQVNAIITNMPDLGCKARSQMINGSR